MARDRVTVQEAARRLGVKDEAIRKRIQRGTLEHDKDPNGRIYVYLDPSSVASEDASYDAFLTSLLDQVSYLRSVLREERDARRRADTIIAQLTQANAALAQRVPELETPQTHEEAAQRAAEEAARVHGQGAAGDPHGSMRPRDTAEFPARGSLSRPWWKRVFGG
jgi:predicted ArsR family transcriptional regulator